MVITLFYKSCGGNLSKTLQSPKLSASERQHIAEMNVRTLETLRNETHFNLFLMKVETTKKEFSVGMYDSKIWSS